MADHRRSARRRTASAAGSREHHGQPAAGGVLGGERAAHGLGEPAGDRQPEADARARRRVAEPLERAEDRLLRGAGTPGPRSTTRSSTRSPSALAVTRTGTSLPGRAARRSRPGWRAPAPAGRRRRRTSGRSSATSSSTVAAGGSPRSAVGTTSSTPTGRRSGGDAPVCSRDMSSRLSIRPLSRSADSSMVASSSPRRPRTSRRRWRRLRRGGLDRWPAGCAGRGRRRRAARCAHPVGLGELPGLAASLRPAARRSSTAAPGRRTPRAGGGRRPPAAPPAQQRGERRRRPRPRRRRPPAAGHGAVPTTRRPSPRAPGRPRSSSATDVSPNASRTRSSSGGSGSRRASTVPASVRERWRLGPGLRGLLGPPRGAGRRRGRRRPPRARRRPPARRRSPARRW